MEWLKTYRPKIATVLDIERKSILDESISWAEEASEYCDSVVLIPKVRSVIKKLPKQVCGKQVILGYSIPTSYGGTKIPIEDFKGRSVHLLGGSPHRQMEYWKSMSNFCNVLSVDGNYAQLVALRFNKFWTNGNAYYAENRWLPRLDEADGMKWMQDAPYEAFRRSCKNIQNAWENLINPMEAL